MKQYNISSQMLPADSLLINRNISFFELYRTQLLLFAFVASILAIMIVSGIPISRQRLNQRLKRAVKDAEAATKEKTAFLALSYMNFSFMPLAKERDIELTITPGTEYVDVFSNHPMILTQSSWICVCRSWTA